MSRPLLAPLVLIVALCGNARAADAIPREEAKGALLKAVRFFHKDVSRHGGYVWAQSADLRLREGEGVADDDSIWVQSPGTPAVGEAFLDSYAATKDPGCLGATRDAAHALVRGQLHSGGWHYRIEFNPQSRRAWAYRADGEIRPPSDQVAAGWEEWKKRRFKGNQTVLDDDTTQSATRFLIRFDAATDFKDETVHQAATHALSSLLNAQYPNGGWSASYDRFPASPPSADAYPVQKARFPAEWPRTWPKDFTGCYVTNDNLVPDMIDTMLLAAEVYGDARYRASAQRAGDFLILAQMPEPQPAWAQQYDRDMAPVWSRAFEPPAVTGGESQGIMLALLRLYRATGEKKYLGPIPSAIDYLKRSRRPDGKLARFYELKNNRPMYFERDAQGKHQLTYGDRNLATGYGYVVDSRVDRIEAQYLVARDGNRDPIAASRSSRVGLRQDTAGRTRSVIDAMDKRGAWVTQGRLQHHGIEPDAGVVDSRIFIQKVKVLCDALVATQDQYLLNRALVE